MQLREDMQNKRRQVSASAYQDGIAMLEALISVVLLALGILGLIAFQAEMTKNATHAKLRGEAAFLANQLIGQMWADRGSLDRYLVVQGACQDETINTCVNWAGAVQATLPSGEANVNPVGDTVNITLSWTLPGEAESQYQISAHILNN